MAVEQAEVSYNRISNLRTPEGIRYTEEERINLSEGGSTDIFRIVRGMDFEPFQRGAEDPGRAVHRNRRRQEQERNSAAIRELRTETLKASSWQNPYKES